MTTSSLTFLDFLKPRRNEAALRLRNSLLALAVLFVITNLSSAFPSVFSSLTVVWNAVTPEPTPSKSHAGGSRNKSEAEVGLWWWTISLIGTCLAVEWKIGLGSENHLQLLPFCFTEGGVCSLLLMSIFQSAFALKYPRDPFPPMSTPVKPFNTSANSPAGLQQSKSKILSPAVHSPGILACFPAHSRVCF